MLTEAYPPTFRGPRVLQYACNTIERDGEPSSRLSSVIGSATENRLSAYRLDGSDHECHSNASNSPSRGPEPIYQVNHDFESSPSPSWLTRNLPAFSLLLLGCSMLAI